MVGLKNFLLLLILFGSQNLLWAGDSTQEATAQLAELAKSRAWRALLHMPATTGASYIRDRDFFLAASGSTDAEAELAASITRLTADQEVRCRYPARLAFLQGLGLLPESETVADCQAFNQWRRNLDVKRAVLVLASSYLNSPSSMYGHSFLRLDPAGERGASPFLSHALNFGARIPARENGLLYAYRGIFGGYPGVFSLQPYYEKIQEYTRLENRDMWEYELNLSQSEIDFLISHVWELNGVHFDYYFFDQNCAYRLLELLEVARPSLDLSSGFEYYAMPVDTIRRVLREDLVAKVDFRASRQLQFEAVAEGLSVDEQRLVLDLAEGRLGVDSPELMSLPESRSQQLLMAAYRLLRYRFNKAIRSDEVSRRSLLLLKASQALGPNPYPSVAVPKRPDQGHPTSQLNIGLGVMEDRPWLDLEWRISYHDDLDGVGGYPRGASLEMMRLRLRWWQQSLKLQEFAPVEIHSLSPRNKYFKAPSWGVKASTERLIGGDGPLVSGIQGDMGGSWDSLAGNLYALGRVRLEYNPEAKANWNMGLGLDIGQLWQGEHMSARVSAQYLDFQDADARLHYQLAMNVKLFSDQALRWKMDYSRRGGKEFAELGLAWRYYF